MAKVAHVEMYQVLRQRELTITTKIRTVWSAFFLRTKKHPEQRCLGIEERAPAAPRQRMGRPAVPAVLGWKHSRMAACLVGDDLGRDGTGYMRLSLFVNSRKTASVAKEQHSWTTTLVVHHAKLFFEMVRVAYMHAPGILFYDGVAGMF